MAMKFPVASHIDSGRRTIFGKKDNLEHGITFRIPTKDNTTVSKRKDAFKIQSDKARDKQAFLEVIERFKVANPSRKGHVEFITVALDHMEEYQVVSDLDVFYELMDLFPKHKMLPETLIQAALYHFPRHQEAGLAILEKMEVGGVMPDRTIRNLVLDTFGSESHVFKKLCRLMYWVPKFKNASPYPLPKPVPRDPRLLARLAIERITGVDLETEVVDLHADDVPDSIDKTWIISGQSPKQQELLAQETGKVPLRIEGPQRVWLRDALISYFCLVGNPREKPEIRINTDDVSNLKLLFFGEKAEPSQDLSLLPTVHEQSDSTIFAVCSTGTSSRDSLLSWLRLLQKTNPCLETLPVVFQLLAPTNALTTIGKGSTNERGFERDCGTEHLVGKSDLDLWDTFVNTEQIKNKQEELVSSDSNTTKT